MSISGQRPHRTTTEQFWAVYCSQHSVDALMVAAQMCMCLHATHSG